MSSSYKHNWFNEPNGKYELSIMNYELNLKNYGI